MLLVDASAVSSQAFATLLSPASRARVLADLDHHFSARGEFVLHFHFPAHNLAKILALRQSGACTPAITDADCIAPGSASPADITQLAAAPLAAGHANGHGHLLDLKMSDLCTPASSPALFLFSAIIGEPAAGIATNTAPYLRLLNGIVGSTDSLELRLRSAINTANAHPMQICGGTPSDIVLRLRALLDGAARTADDFYIFAPNYIAHLPTLAAMLLGGGALPPTDALADDVVAVYNALTTTTSTNNQSTFVPTASALRLLESGVAALLPRDVMISTRGAQLLALLYVVAGERSAEIGKPGALTQAILNCEPYTTLHSRLVEAAMDEDGKLYALLISGLVPVRKILSGIAVPGECTAYSEARVQAPGLARKLSSLLRACTRAGADKNTYTSGASAKSLLAGRFSLTSLGTYLAPLGTALTGAQASAQRSSTTAPTASTSRS